MSGKYGAVAETKSKKKLIIIISVILAVIIAGVAVYFVFFTGKDLKMSDSRVTSDIKKSEVLTKQTVGKRAYDFAVDSVELKGANQDQTVHNAVVTVKNDTYSFENQEVSAEYTIDGEAYKLQKIEITAKGTLKAVGGVDENEATEEIKKTYKNAKLKSHKTDLNKGKDTLIFSATTEDMTGTVTLSYSFDDKNGWVLKKTDKSKMSIKEGKTGQVDVDGVKCYTNSAVKNILLLGTDADDGARRSDSMMLISIDSNNKEIKFSSFMRDTYVDIDGYDKDKLNAAFAYGGPELATKTIEKNYGIKIDNYITTGFSDFKKIVNTLGGVDIELDQDECGYINWQLNKNGQAGDVGEVEVKDGVQRLNGQQALWFCRDRGSEQFRGSDFTRTQRQRRMLMGLVESYKNNTVADIIKITNDLRPYVETDLSKEDIAWLCEHSDTFFTYKTSDKCYPEETSGWQAGTSPVGGWIIEMNSWEDTRKDIAHYIYTDLK